jgi:hypothetical protein
MQSSIPPRVAHTKGSGGQLPAHSSPSTPFLALPNHRREFIRNDSAVTFGANFTATAKKRASQCRTTVTQRNNLLQRLRRVADCWGSTVLTTIVITNPSASVGAYHKIDPL